MNLYRFELKAHLKTLVWGTAGLLAALLVLLLGIYPVFESSLDSVLQIIRNFPPQFSAAFGLDIAALFSFGGFYSFCFSYLSLLGAIMAASLSLFSFSREKRAKCTDFLLTKPVSRQKVFVAKLFAGLTVLVLANAVYVPAALWAAARYNETGPSMVWGACALFFTQLVFFAAGALYAGAAKKVRSVAGAATAFGFVGFLLSALVNLLEEDAVRYLAPLKYFDPTDVFSTGGFAAPYAVTGVLVTLGCLLTAFVWFCHRDTHAV